MDQTPPFISPLPESHVYSLAAIEAGYWWYEGRIYWASRLLKELIEKNSGFKPKTYCDLGCGTGGFASRFASHFLFENSTLVDWDPKVLALTSRYPGFDVEQKDLNSPFSIEPKPDVITCMDVLEHIEKDDQFLQSAVKSLTKNGVFIATVPACPWLYSEWDRNLGHHRRYTKSQLKALFQSAGMEVESIHYMWSFMSPFGLLRKFRSHAADESMGFNKVPRILNSLLIFISQLEYTVSKLISPLIGTSLIAIAKKRD